MRLLDHLISKSKQPSRNSEAERTRGVEVDHQLEFG
jgi:hypothetical protein